MKRMTNNLMTAAAVLMIGAGVASAQDAMRAEIPFAFSAGGSVTEPGTYVVRITSGASSTKILGLYNETTHRTYMMAAMLQSGLDIAGIVTHELPADRFEKAFAIVEGGECGKVILDWA